MKKRIFSIILMIVLVAGYGTFLYFYEKDDHNTAPEIVFENSHLEISVNDDDSKLLEGVTAYDQEDGDLTSGIIVDSISMFDNAKNRTVKYVVFDKENKASVATRTISYADYTAPKIYLTDSLIQNTSSVSKMNQLVSAVSCVDGDITKNVAVKSEALQENKIQMKINVYDSTGTESGMTLVYEYDSNLYPAKICLKEYLLYLPVGSTYDLKSNVSEIQQGNEVNQELLELVQVESGVDFNTPGIYEIYYYLNSRSGVSAHTKGIIVIE